MELIFDRNIKYEKRLEVKLYNNIYFENNGSEKKPFILYNSTFLGDKTILLQQYILWKQRIENI